MILLELCFFHVTAVTIDQYLLFMAVRPPFLLFVFMPSVVRRAAIFFVNLKPFYLRFIDL